MTYDLSEEDRLRQLKDLDLLDSMPEEEFNQLVRLASSICGTPISLVSLVDKDRQWFKAKIGLTALETPRNVSFCSHAIRTPNLFVVNDATLDRRFQDNTLVTGAPGIRFYAGVPLQAPGGALVGTLCVIDTVPRVLSDSQIDGLTILGLQVQARLALRHRNKAFEVALAENSRLLRKLEEGNELFRAFTDNGPFVSYLKDADGRFVSYNKRLTERFHLEAGAWIGLKDCDVFPVKVADKFRQHDCKVLQMKMAGVAVEIDEEFPDEDGEVSTWHSYKFRVVMEDGQPLLAGMSMDITEKLRKQQALETALAEKSELAAKLEKANQELDRLATTDALTGLWNRRHFDERTAIEFAVARRKKRPLALLVLDVDNFKKRNDTFGHAAGDEALRKIARVLKKNVRTGDIVARLGGEEFGHLLTDCDLRAAEVLAKRTLNQIRAIVTDQAPLTVSLGIAVVNDSVESFEGLVACADEAMYEAKRSGKDRLIVHPSANKPMLVGKHLSASRQIA